MASVGGAGRGPRPAPYTEAPLATTFREWQARQAASADEAEARAREMAERHGCRLLRHGKAWRVCGPQVDVLAADLRWIRDNDLRPAEWAGR